METIKVNEMIRQIREANYERTKHLSNEELITYFHETAKRVHAEIHQSRNQQRQPLPETLEMT
jgi:L-lactate utilization protein LutC